MLCWMIESDPLINHCYSPAVRRKEHEKNSAIDMIKSQRYFIDVTVITINMNKKSIFASKENVTILAAIIVIFDTSL